MATSTVENYTKQIFLESERSGEPVVAMGRVAEALEVAPGTATTMAKSLAKAGLADYEPRAGIRLTEEGRQLAIRILRRHRLVEYFLVETLKMDWAEIHEEAEALEHAISDRLLEHLDRFLGYPDHDPHGDPIPNAEGRFVERELVPLSDCAKGDSVQVSRVIDQDGAFLNFASEAGLVPGATVGVVRLLPSADCLEIRVAGRKVRPLGLSAAAKILVSHH